ncbi:OPT superfamily oligopeptide transporter [Linderina pennispora]|uniref:OPT superfamily oligopeptide transporter n=1 Tax=Linderina pennispora TaxID=61395 RepID=A0A1Y1WJ43_9FUNG|nr:OPT superfamily oligopeptide transporter [Linderina pennispora]ORX73559.1 OPT superfamily oligopeptide transporter [Linderina pennispora]
MFTSVDEKADAKQDLSALPADSPIEEVRAAVLPSDDTSIPSTTFRSLVLGVVFTLVLSFVNQFFWFRAQPLTVGILVVQLVTFPIGKFMARIIPNKTVGFGRLRFSLNPGDFSVKEHVLLTIMANSAATTAMGIDIIVIMRTKFELGFGWGGDFLLVISSQILGRFLVTPSSMVWPVNLVNATLFNTLHGRKPPSVQDAENEGSEQEHASFWGRLTRGKFFLLVFACSFVYYWLPGISWVCWINKKNVTVSQIGSGLHGLAFLPTPLSIPVWAHLNMLVGFVLFIWILVPAFYWTGTFHAKYFPIYNTKLYDSNGSRYDLDRVLIKGTNMLNRDAYNEYSPVYQTVFFALCYGQGLATLGAIISHTILFPDWWYAVLFVVAFAMAMVTITCFPSDTPWWGMILALVLAIGFTLPLGLIMAVTSQTPSISMIAEWVMGAILPGRPNFSTVICQQALGLTQDLKLGHYMKIPPRELFANVCTEEGYPWTCPNASTWGAGSVIWGVVGPKEYFSKHSVYHSVPYFLLIGFLLPIPVYFVYRWKPQSWIRHVHIPVMMLGPGPYPPAPTSELPTWVAIGLVFNGIIKRYRNRWWRKFNYVLSAGLDSGVAIAALVIFFALQNQETHFPNWWGNPADGPVDQCPLATVAVQGALAYQG